jgi:endonuclease/exonuclease/phosphatase family metal-dependent hydrolase
MKTSKFLHFLIYGFLFAVILHCYSTKNYLDPEGPRFTGNYSETTAPAGDTIKVVSFNIKYALEIEQAIRELGSIPQIKDADILLLQEMNEDATDFIARHLNYNFVYYPATVHPQIKYNFGNAVLSKWPIKADRKVILPYEPVIGKTKRIAVCAQVTIGTTQIITYSVHTATMTLSTDKRLSQADSLIKSIALENKHVVVGGDFNTVFTETIRNLDELFEKNSFVRATIDVGPTLEKGPFDFTMDHIYVKGFKVIDYGSVPTEASDHKPIWTLLTLERKE